jgi:hypothetical protein
MFLRLGFELLEGGEGKERKEPDEKEKDDCLEKCFFVAVRIYDYG